MKPTQAIQPLLAQALRQMLALATGGENLPAITLPAAAKPSAPALLARAPGVTGGKGKPSPASETTELYSRCLALYRERVQAGGEQDDLGCAAALFVVANLSALGRGEGADTTTLTALTQQMQNALQRLPDWTTTSLEQKQLMFEQLALLSVLVTQSAEAAAGQGPLARANVRAAAQSYLRQWLAVDPELLTLSPQGLVVDAAALARRTHKALAA
jgi:hypothetical protein